MSSSVAASHGTEPRFGTMDLELAPAQSKTSTPVFLPDNSDGDREGGSAAALVLAELLGHRQAGTPFLVALTGSAGSGKSSFIRQIFGRIGAAAEGGTALNKVVTVRVDASTGSDPATTILSRILGALGATYPHLAEEAAYAGGDPVKMARAAGERLTDLRRQLDRERQSLDELSGRRARLAETVLFNTPGSQIETYARQNRGRIEARLRAFGLPTNEPIATYKTLVREAAENGAGRSRVGVALRALWGFKGQGRLIGLAIVLLLAGWLSSMLAENQDAWIGWLNGFGDRFAGPTAWAQAHADWLAPLSHAAYALAALAVLIAIVRAIRFLQPIFRGVSLLSADLDGRRRDLDAMLAHETRRVDHLTSEVDAAVRSADAAERRVETRKAAGSLHPARALAGEGVPVSSYDTAETVLAGLADALGGTATPSGAEAPSGAETRPGADARPGAETPALPDRIVVAIDELDRLPAQAAAAYLETAQRLLRRPHFAGLAAFERSHMLAGFSETDPGLAAAQLNRCIQLSYDLDAAGAAQSSASAPDAHRATALAQPWSDVETRLVQALAPFAGPNPRSIKRFVNSVRVARSDPKLAGASAAELAGLAVALALDGTGAGAELWHLGDGAMVNAGGSDGSPPLLAQALMAAQTATGGSFTAGEMQRGLQVARIYSRHG